jgi:DNA mismatch endonuclease (patch repair protein)
MPSSRQDYWIPKLEGNRQRDSANQAKLQAAGWQVLVIWECEVANREKLSARIKDFLEDFS